MCISGKVIKENITCGGNVVMNINVGLSIDLSMTKNPQETNSASLARLVLPRRSLHLSASFIPAYKILDEVACSADYSKYDPSLISIIHVDCTEG